MSIKRNQNLELVCPRFATKVEDLRRRREKRNEEENKVGNRKVAWDGGEGCPLVLTSFIQPRNKLFRISLSCPVLF
jgi:hypothetical protein